MRRTLLVTLLVTPMLWATAARAQEAPAPPPAAGSASPSPVPAASTAPPPSVPQPEFVPDPETRPTPHWYGWQPAIFDAAAALQGVLAYTLDAPALYATAGVTYVVGPLGVHLYHGRMGNVVLGAGLRLGFPGIGAVTGFAIDKAGSGGRSTGTVGSTFGVGVGCLVAAVLDDVVNSHELLQFWEVGLTVTPTISRESRGLSVSGTF